MKKLAAIIILLTRIASAQTTFSGGPLTISGGPLTVSSGTPPPIASFSASESSPLLVGTSVNFLDQSQNAGGAIYSWTIGYTNYVMFTSTSQNPSYTFSSPGNWVISETVTTAGGASTATMLMQGALPVDAAYDLSNNVIGTQATALNISNCFIAGSSNGMFNFYTSNVDLASSSLNGTFFTNVTTYPHLPIALNGTINSLQYGGGGLCLSFTNQNHQWFWAYDTNTTTLTNYFAAWIFSTPQQNGTSGFADAVGIGDAMYATEFGGTPWVMNRWLGISPNGTNNGISMETLIGGSANYGTNGVNGTNNYSAGPYLNIGSSGTVGGATMATAPQPALYQAIGYAEKNTGLCFLGIENLATGSSTWVTNYSTNNYPFTGFSCGHVSGEINVFTNSSGGGPPYTQVLVGDNLQTISGTAIPEAITCAYLRIDANFTWLGNNALLVLTNMLSGL